MTGAWIVVAEKSRARIFRAATAAAPLDEVRTFEHPESRAKAADLVSDGKSLVFQSVGGGKHAVGAATDPKDHEAENFAREIVRTLESGRSEHLFDRLVVVAPPAFLGQLRGMFSPPLAKMVKFEIDKNLVQLPPKEIREHLPRNLWI